MPALFLTLHLQFMKFAGSTIPEDLSTRCQDSGILLMLAAVGLGSRWITCSAARSFTGRPSRQRQKEPSKVGSYHLWSQFAGTLYIFAFNGCSAHMKKLQFALRTAEDKISVSEIVRVIPAFVSSSKACVCLGGQLFLFEIILKKSRLEPRFREHTWGEHLRIPLWHKLRSQA